METEYIYVYITWCPKSLPNWIVFNLKLAWNQPFWPVPKMLVAYVYIYIYIYIFLNPTLLLHGTTHLLQKLTFLLHGQCTNGSKFMMNIFSWQICRSHICNKKSINVIRKRQLTMEKFIMLNGLPEVRLHIKPLFVWTQIN